MISKLETLPDEILLGIFSYLSWDKILISLWSINRRINYVIYSVFSMEKSGLVFNQSDLSYKNFSSILLPLILNSSYLSSLIKYIHFDGTYSNSYNIINKCLYNQQILCFPNPEMGKSAFFPTQVKSSHFLKISSQVKSSHDLLKIISSQVKSSHDLFNILSSQVKSSHSSVQENSKSSQVIVQSKKIPSQVKSSQK
ncbi:unnamed protein product [Rotaria socialis]|uniref:F-box domain-containing protein n=1 Tax=Rotaria socialis TaxID=392032 RepID=A0A818SIE9_9BILA|nr:unnamed protein product [Rotaria socialis]CAF4637607.1 unnamed protein product [Rotaria socialis]